MNIEYYSEGFQIIIIYAVHHKNITYTLYELYVYIFLANNNSLIIAT